MHLSLQGIDPEVNKRIAWGTAGDGLGGRLGGGTQEEGSAQLPVVQEESVLSSGPHPPTLSLLSIT